MLRRLVVLVVLCALAVLALPAAGSAAPPDRYIVVLKSGDPGTVAREHGRKHGADTRHVYRSALRGYAARIPAGRVDRVRADSRVAYVEPDAEVRAFATQSGATWGLDRSDQRALPLSGSFTTTADGAGVNAYVIDTGIRFSHGDFGGRAVSGRDAVDGDFDASDCNGHGTHVAGTVGGGAYGIAKGTRLVGVRVLDCAGSGSISGVIAGVDWVTADHDPGEDAVANMSLGGGASTALDDAVKRSIADGISYAVAAGNGNQGGRAQDACKYSPARVADAITIGATDKTDTKTSWSNYGKCVDWFAPGLGITSAWHTSDTDIKTISGTSMATPHAAGVAALYLAANPDPAVTPADVRAALYDRTTKGIVKQSKTANNHLLFTDW